MSTATRLPPDPLSLLRASVSTSTPPIPTSSDDPTSQAHSDVDFARAAYLIFNTQSPETGAEHNAVSLTQPTRFISQAAGDKPLDLRSIYFCWLNREKGAGDYIAATQALNAELSSQGRSDAEKVVNLVFAEKLDLVNWLSGELGEDESEYIRSLDDTTQTRQEAAANADNAAGGPDVEMRDAGLPHDAARKAEQERMRLIYAGERRMLDRNTVLHGPKPTDFSHVRAHASLYLRALRAAAAAAHQPSTTLTANPAPRPSAKAAATARRPEPIILLSPSASSLLRMPNIKAFLADGVYSAPDAGGGADAAATILHLTRLLPAIDAARPLRFILVDSPENFRPDYWARVVAVFTTGQTWQFKNYKWQSAAELFEHVLGVYVGWKGEAVPESVRGWGRGVLSVQLDKPGGVGVGGGRWRDREVVEELWSGIEGRMRASGWGREGR